MPSRAALGQRIAHSHERVLSVLGKHAPREHVDHLKASAPQATVRNPEHLAALQAEMIAQLADLVDGLLTEKSGATTAKKSKKS